MARAMYPTFKNFKLDTIAANLKIEQKHHHRADDDARVLAEIFLKMLDTLCEEKHITTVMEINKSLNRQDISKARA